MKLRYLRTARIFTSILFFTSALFLFVDITGFIQQNFSTEILFLQFIPSLIGFIGALGLTSIGFIIIIIVTLLFGRVYCSSVCPLGILQDLMIFTKRKIGKKSFKKQKFSYAIPFSKTRFLFLSTAILLLLFGIITGITLLDPYSNFGRIITSLFRPIIIGLNNLLVLVLELFNNYSIYPIEFKGINFFSFLFSIFVFGLILFMSITHGRLFCNSVCPVGTLLGYISKLSFYKIKIDESTCKECGVCAKVCKANCIDLETNFVDETRCINCFNCLEVCPSAGITYQRKKTVKDLPSESKRDFIKNITIFLIGANILSKAQDKIKVYKESTIPVIRKNGISPPGSISLEHFNENCTACHLCVSACPTQVIQPSFLEYGLLGIMQPLMNYKIGFCNYDCVICGDVCPTGAITNQFIDNKKLIQLGVAKFVKENCIVYSQGTDCGACAEHCPTKAVKMVLDIEVNKKAPVINEEICIGCGACEYACPTKPYKSIFIESNPIHKLAQKPKEDELKEKVDLKEEFPF